MWNLILKQGGSKMPQKQLKSSLKKKRLLLFLYPDALPAFVLQSLACPYFAFLAENPFLTAKGCVCSSLQGQQRKQR
jgi:hypothetical protein